MKQILFSITLCLAIVLTGCQSSKPLSPEQQARADALALKIESFDFAFTPRSIKPMSGRTLQLSGGYYLDLSPQYVKAYLPYMGRAYVAPTNPRSIGIDFKTEKFEYTSFQKKPGLYEIKITPQNLSNLEDRGTVFYLTVDNNGYGTLTVQFTNRQSVSYYGTID